MQPDAATSDFEYGVRYHTDVVEPHRLGMTEAEAREWIVEWREMGGKPDAFHIIRRWIGPWERVEEHTGKP